MLTRLRRIRARRQRDQPRRRSRTQAEWLAALRWNIKDATEALTNAVGMKDWEGVVKYARQIQALERKETSAQQTGTYRRYDPRRARWENVRGMTGAQYEAAYQAQRRGRSGLPLSASEKSAAAKARRSLLGTTIRSGGTRLIVKKVLSDRWVVARNQNGNFVILNRNPYTNRWDALDWFDDFKEASLTLQKRAGQYD